jgi:hypothetical protein
MEKNYSESGKNLASKVPGDIADAFRKQAKERGQQVKYNLAAAAKLWISLPIEVQARLLDKSLSDSNLMELIDQMVTDRIAAGRETGRSLIERQKQKRPKKD